MIEKAIENWLTNTNERTYQGPFCQVLLQNGHTVVHVSSHGPLEQGKDIISLDADGATCAYQLKTGNIGLGKWREIKGEVEDLVELPVVHPSVDKDSIHKSYLVTNGRITDPVRIRISQMNERNRSRGRGFSYLDVIAGDQLLKVFLDAQGEFIPAEPKEFELFLKLFLADGTGFLNKEVFFTFLNGSLFEDSRLSKRSSRDAICASAVITGYLLDSYQRKGNSYALFEAWICLAACIVRHASMCRMAEKHWKPSLKLILSEAVENLCRLKEEALDRRHLVEGSLIGDGSFVYQARATIVLGCLAALQCYLERRGGARRRDPRLLDHIRRHLRRLAFWGEWSFACLFWIIKYLELEGAKEAAHFLLKRVLELTVGLSSPSRETGLPSPYYSADDLLESSLDAALGIPWREIDLGQFSGSSYALGAIVDLAARRGARELLETYWPEISRIHIQEFRPDNVEDTFLWRASDGSNHQECLNATQSWRALVDRANDLSEVPKLLANHSDLLSFFVLACPHRATRQIITVLDKAV